MGDDLLVSVENPESINFGLVHTSPTAPEPTPTVKHVPVPVDVDDEEEPPTTTVVPVELEPPGTVVDA